MSNENPGETVSAIGFNVKQINKGNLMIKAWDLGGQKQFRSEWARYASGANVIIFVVDSSAADLITYSRRELNYMLEERDLSNIPILILANKIDLNPHLTEPEIIAGLNLHDIIGNPWQVISISALKGINLERVVDWLLNVKNN